MDDALALSELEELVAKLGIEVRQEDLPGAGGLCQVRGKWILFVSSGLSVSEQVDVIARALGGMDLSSVYVRPALRQLLGAGEGGDS